MPKRKLDYHPYTLWNVPDDRHFFREEGSGLYSYMFIEDVTNRVMPYSAHSSRSDKSFKVVVNDSSAEMEIKTLFHLSYGHDPYYQPLSEAIFDFIRNVSGFLLARGGRAYFEIVEASIEDDGVSKAVFVLKPIHGKVARFGRTYYQVIPKDMREDKKKFISVPQSKIWILEIPKELGGFSDIISLSNNLNNLGKASFIDSRVLMNKIDLYGFNVSDFHSMIEALLILEI